MREREKYFSRHPSPPPPPPRAIIPDARPLSTIAVTVRSGISKRSHEKIGDWEQSSGFAINCDLKSGYHHLPVDICPRDRQFLGFAWIFPDVKERFLMFNVLPLSSTLYMFTKLFKPLVKHWRSRYFHSVVYLGDGLYIEDSLNEPTTSALMILKAICVFPLLLLLVFT